MLERTTGDCVEVNQVSVDNFRAIEKSRDSKCRKLRLFYEQQRSALIITLPTSSHELLHRWLDERIGIRVYAMGMYDQLDVVGAATYVTTSGGSLGTSLEGDSCRRPSSRSGSDGWPVLVIEAGYSQTIQQLRRRAQAWFLASNFEVKIVILAKMIATRGHIVLEKWKGVAGQASGLRVRTRAQTRRDQGARVPQCIHTIHISRSNDADNDPLSPGSYRVFSGALRLEFEDLFLRSAVEEEGDIVITEEELQRFASKVWSVPV